MNRRSVARVTRFLLLVAAASGGIMAACASGDSRPAPAGEATGIPVGPVTIVEAGQGEGGADAGGDVDLCVGRAQMGTVVNAVRTNDPLPTRAGGNPPPGTYVLTEMYIHTTIADGGSTDSGYGGRVTAYFDTTTVAFVTSRGPVAALPADNITTDKYVITGTNLVLDSICPVPGIKSSFPFTWDGTKLGVNIDSETSEVYVKQ